MSVSRSFKGAVIVAAIMGLCFEARPARAQWNNDAPGRISYSGQIGVGGASSPSYTFLVKADYPNFAMVTNTSANPVYATFVNGGGGAYFGVEGSGGNSIINSGGLPYALAFQAGGFTSPVQFSTAGAARLTILPSGNIGVGTNAPTSKLHVVGDIYSSGTISGANVVANYQDVAEWVPANADLEPGTVVVVDPAQENHVMPSASPYDTKVAGVVSASPGVTLGVPAPGKETVATTGRVKVRVDATGTPIRVGDLLVTSAKSGVAMRSTPLDVGGVTIHRPGTIIGKALQPLASGEGEILVLLSLQ